MTKRETAAEIEEAVTRWLWKRESGVWAEGDDQALRTWLEASSARRGAFLRAEAAFVTLDRLGWTPGGQIQADRSQPTRRRLVVGGLAAAGVAGAVLLSQGRTYVSPEREIRSIALNDGSAATLNSATALRVDMEGAERRIALKRGEAFFKVNPDRARPFLVSAGALRVRAVGTAFSVLHAGDRSRVVVTEGVVEVWRRDETAGRMRVKAGEAAEARPSEALVKMVLGEGEADRGLAWRFGRVDLNGQTLEEATAQFNRYNEVQLVVAEPALQGRRLYGVFDVRDPWAFAKTAGLAVGAPVRRKEKEIRIGRRPDRQNS